MKLNRITLSESSTRKLQTFKARTGLTPNIACRLALGLSLSQKKRPSLELHIDETGQTINRYTLLGEHELILLSLFKQWCHEHDISESEYESYFIAHINQGVEMLINRVKGLQDFTNLLPAR